MMASLLLENTWRLLAMLVATQFILIVIWSRMRVRPWSTMVKAGFITFPLLLLLCHFVQTPREQVIVLCKELAKAIEKGDINSVAPSLSYTFEAAGLDRDAFLERAERTLSRFEVSYARLSAFEVDLSDSTTAIATFRASCSVDSTEGAIPYLVTLWKLTLRRESDTWRVCNVETIPTPPLNAKNLRELLR